MKHLYRIVCDCNCLLPHYPTRTAIIDSVLDFTVIKIIQKIYIKSSVEWFLYTNVYHGNFQLFDLMDYEKIKVLQLIAYPAITEQGQYTKFHLPWSTTGDGRLGQQIPSGGGVGFGQDPGHERQLSRVPEQPTAERDLQWGLTFRHSGCPHTSCWQGRG